MTKNIKRYLVVVIGLAAFGLLILLVIARFAFSFGGSYPITRGEFNIYASEFGRVDNYKESTGQLFGQKYPKQVADPQKPCDDLYYNYLSYFRVANVIFADNQTEPKASDWEDLGIRIDGHLYQKKFGNKYVCTFISRVGDSWIPEEASNPYYVGTVFYAPQN